ncbi:MAG: carbohydrate ABC transporter permease [Planctomycetota bacterium]
MTFWRGPKAWFTHAALGGVGIFFLIPLVWMLSTALKPDEQTMEMPPRFLPYGTLAKLDGQRMVVTRAPAAIGSPGYVVKMQADPPVGAPLKGQSKPVDVADFSLLPRALHDPALLPTERPPAQAAGTAGFARVEIPVGDKSDFVWLPAVVEHPYAASDYMVKKATPTESYGAAGGSGSKAAGADQRLAWDILPKSQLEEHVQPMWENFPASLERMNFLQYLFNTIFVCTLTVAGIVVSSVIIAYAFAFLPFPGRGPLFIITLATMMIPFPVTMIVMYDLFHRLGWLGSFKPLWVPAWFGSAFFIFLLRQFFLGLPKELLDAARMDGCGELEILWHVVLPLSKPAIAMVALFTFLGCWSDYMGPLLYLVNKDSFTLALGLANYHGQHGGTPWNLLMAANLVFSLPLILLFLLTLKTFIKGIATTGMKG